MLNQLKNSEVSNVDNQLLLAYYGDDFTGSTDALEFMSRAGAKTALFIEPPTPEQLASYEGLNAIGIAGMTRSMPPDVMEKTLHLAFTELRKLGVRHVHYKVCSTFDSSPHIGSIGKAIDVGQAVFQNTFVPLLVAAPSLGRYCLFGNLFARLGIGSDGQIFRLDRHPSMRKHPVTPADESDLRVHLSKQTTKKIGLLDILQITKPQSAIRTTIESLVQNQSEVILIDALYEDQLLAIGKTIDEYVPTQQPLFSVGSSGIEMALGKYWVNTQVLHPQTNWPTLGKATPLLVLSGSCSPVTTGQITWAKNNGFNEIMIDAHAIHAASEISSTLSEYIQQSVAFIREGASLIVHTNGSEASAKQLLSSEKLGTALGIIAKGIVQQTAIKRVVVAGGDTSSYAARAMGIEAVEMIAPLVAGAPVCRVIAPYSPLNGIEINFKGGQVGSENYFGMLLKGR